MGHCDVMYRVGYTPWEHPSEAWTSSFAQWPRGRPATGEGLSERIAVPGPAWAIPSSGSGYWVIMG